MSQKVAISTLQQNSRASCNEHSGTQMEMELKLRLFRPNPSVEASVDGAVHEAHPPVTMTYK